jgi:lactaldehyde reductase
MLLPTVMRFNMPAAKEKYVDIAKACGVYQQGMSVDQAAEAACKAIEDLSARVGTNKKLTDLGITEKDIDALADQAIRDVCTPGNPREVTRDDIVSLYKQIL